MEGSGQKGKLEGEMGSGGGWGSGRAGRGVRGKRGGLGLGRKVDCRPGMAGREGVMREE